jgi:hypothetical protein
MWIVHERITCTDHFNNIQRHILTLLLTSVTPRWRLTAVHAHRYRETRANGDNAVAMVIVRAVDDSLNAEVPRHATRTNSGRAGGEL